MTAMGSEDTLKHSVLHITPHLGGGVGKVLLNYLSGANGKSKFSHKIMCLDYANSNALQVAQAAGFSLFDNMAFHHDEMVAAIAESDITLIHWWNHPLLYTFLIRETLPPVRLILWSHVSGLYSPYAFTPALLDYPDIFVFTTPISLETAEVESLPDSRKSSLRVIWSTAGTDPSASVRRRSHEGFRVGYIGTVDYCKMHPDFLRMSSKVSIPGVHFIVCGGPCEEEVRKEARSLGIEGRFTFTGQTHRIIDYLSEFDVFGYPLSPTHYGTCDQVLVESMAAGVPPVVLSNSMERYMVRDGITGVVVDDEIGYAQALQGLHRRPEWREHLSRNAREEAKSRFSLEPMINQWEILFEETLQRQKSGKNWTGNYKGKEVSPAHIFIESLGERGEIFRQSIRACQTQQKQKEITDERIRELAGSSPLWRSKTRGTVHHYHTFFPEDRMIAHWSALMGSAEDRYA